jgi:trk system potassium uptake protein TrkA
MRAAFIGAGPLTVMTARQLLKRGHEVIIVDRSKERIDALAGDLDCGFLHGDGSRPAILKEIMVENTHTLFCLTGSDETNILASIVGRSLGFARVVTKIDEPELEHMCIELGLEYTIIPSRTTGRLLADMFEGRDPLELSTMIREEARVVSLVVQEAEEGAIDGLELPEKSRVVCVYRDGSLIIPSGDTSLKKKDEVVVITHRDNLDTFRKRLDEQSGNRT